MPARARRASRARETRALADDRNELATCDLLHVTVIDGS